MSMGIWILVLLLTVSVSDEFVGYLTNVIFSVLKKAVTQGPGIRFRVVLVNHRNTPHLHRLEVAPGVSAPICLGSVWMMSGTPHPIGTGAQAFPCSLEGREIC